MPKQLLDRTNVVARLQQVRRKRMPDYADDEKRVFGLALIDDWLLAPLTDAERRDLLEVLEDRSERTSTLIASQLPPTAWHAAIGEPSVADAICDRLIHHAHRLTLTGPTMRDPGTRRGTKAKA